MGYVGYNEETDAVPEKTGGTGPLLFVNKTNVEVQLGKVQGKVLPQGDMIVSTVAKVLGNDGTPIGGAPWAEFLVSLPFKNPDRDDHEVANKDKKRRYTDCYKFMRAIKNDAPAKFQWDSSAKAYIDEDGEIVDRDKAQAHNTECERAGANFVAAIFNQCLETVEGDPSEWLGAGSFGGTKLIEMEGITGENFFTKIHHRDKTYTTKKGETKQQAPRIYYVTTSAPDDVVYEYNELFVA